MALQKSRKTDSLIFTATIMGSFYNDGVLNFVLIDKILKRED